MALSRTVLILCAAGGSFFLLGAALAFQHLGGLAPCELCLWQRWPHAAAVVIGGLALVLPGRLLPLAGGAAALATAGIGIYHTGVERGAWQGPGTCSSPTTGDVSTDELFDQIMAAPLVRCDEVAWEMLGLSMASWNALAALCLAVLWLMAARTG